MEFEARIERRQFIRSVSLIGAGAGLASVAWGAVDTVGQAVALVQALESAASQLESRSSNSNLEGYKQVGVVNHLAKDNSPRTKLVGGIILSVASTLGFVVSSDSQ
ncbi:MAG: hypothetical protein CEO21_417 [Microgenomates group bacterium Gr01-1014_80]|nr:MAG: hypothetical protein CEO21_417 [Microgenomates group bacterium Gr01-1014_80]